ncbi:MAG: fibronectin type III domain-containing protein [Marinagarivorans sp.]|nr:fibronectin type III domain-containing protein [Marinagarivorans sp.]
MLVNKVRFERLNYTAACGELLAACGEERAACGDYDGVVSGFIEYETPPDGWQYFMYVCGETWPDLAPVSADRRDELESLVLSIKPAHLWSGMGIFYGGAPSAPQSLALEPGDEEIIATWDAPLAGEVDGYKVSIRVSPDGPWTEYTLGDVLTRTFTGLTNGIEYDVRVIAFNAAGDGAWSDIETSEPESGVVPGSIWGPMSRGLGSGAFGDINYLYPMAGGVVAAKTGLGTRTISLDEGATWGALAINSDIRVSNFNGVTITGGTSLVNSQWSEDGVTWHEITMAARPTQGVMDGNTQFGPMLYSETGVIVYCAFQDNWVHRSTDNGKTWSAVQIPNGPGGIGFQGYSSFQFGDFILYVSEYAYATRSLDQGATFETTLSYVQESAQYNRCLKKGNYLILFDTTSGWFVTSNTNAAPYTTEGTGWVSTYPALPNAAKEVYWAYGSTAIAMDDDGNYSRSDGYGYYGTWVALPQYLGLGYEYTGRKLILFNSKVIIYGHFSSALPATSSDNGVTWVASADRFNSGATTGGLQRLFEFAGKLISIWDGNWASYSVDGATWVRLPRYLQSTTLPDSVSGTYYNKSPNPYITSEGLCMILFGRSVVWSLDGITWEIQPAGLNSGSSTTYWQSITETSTGKLMVGGTSGWAAISPPL